MTHIPRLLASILALSSLSSSLIAQPNPALLPTASTSHTPLTSAYNALNVPGKTAGTFYLDPTTQARVYKLTDNNFPTPGLSWGHDYSEGNDEVSLPYSVGGVSRRSILLRELIGPNWMHWLVDFRPGTSPAISNPRLLPEAWNWRAIAFTFSNNPDTPNIAYYVDGNTIRRMDVATLQELPPGGGFPLGSACSNGERPSWFHQSKNDGMFVWMCGNGPVVAAYKPAGVKREFTVSGSNEPRIDRDGRFIGISMTTPQNALRVWDWDAGPEGELVWSRDGVVPFAHQASMRGRWYSLDWNITHPSQFTKFDPVAETATYIGGPAHSALSHGSGNWVQPAAPLDGQWALFSHYGGLQPATNPGWLAPGAMFFFMENPARRHVLGHPYNTSPHNDYDRMTYAKVSSDGHFVLFTSDMNGSGRADVFLAEVPTSGGNPTPTPTPTPVGPTPTPTPTPSSCGWSRIEQDAPSVVYTGESWFTLNNGVHSGGSAKEGMDTGYRATLTFTGTGVRWIAYRDEWAGIARVFVDGVDQGTFDTYRTPNLAQATMFEKTGLSSGSHTLAIEVTGQKNASSGGYWIWVDAFELQSGCAPTPTPTPPPTQWNRIEQGHSSVVYTGTQWFTLTNGVHSGGSARESMDTAHRATVTFTGTGVRWISYRDEWAGIARVYVDGVDQGTVDTYRTPNLAQTVMFEKTSLAAGSHTMAIEVTGTKNAASGGYWIWVDAFEIQQ